MNRFLFLLLLAPMCVLGQTTGINFEKQLNWTQLQDKARTENKFIFIDCMATWCRPCKTMDQRVFSDDSLGKLMSDRFIAVRVQFDSTKADNNEVKSWREQSKVFSKKYDIRSFPTFLFFSPDGKLVHRDAGYKDKNNFARLMSDALDEAAQYYTLLNEYRKGKRDYVAMRRIVNVARSIGDNSIADTVSKNYIHGYLLKLSSQQLFAKDNLYFFAANVNPNDAKVTKLFWKDSASINRVAGENFSLMVLDGRIIRKKYIDPKIYIQGTSQFVSKEPNWEAISKQISKHFDKATAWRNLIFARLDWYKGNDQWENVGKTYVEWYDRVGVDLSPTGRTNTNYVCWDEIFMHVNDTTVLRKAMGWIKAVIDVEMTDPCVDTYANYLYRLGDIKAALEWEEKAVKLNPENKANVDNLEKMKKGLPTWR